jgi:4-diphosphocytidyl-2-C-methyl-D-erythritol kinase
MADTWEAPAKINLHLRIGRKRADGYHELESVLVPLAFGDTLRVGFAGGDGPPLITMEGLFPGAVPYEENILFRAWSLFRETTGFARRLEIGALKRVPPGGGLGGGSSDAAALLAALNRLSGARLSGDSLGKLAERLGSDVPFFLFGKPAFAGGRGERLEPVDIPSGLSVVLVNPGFSSDTARAYRMLDEYRLKRGITAGEAGGIRPALTRILREDPRVWPFVNDFLPVFRDTGTENGEGAAYGEILSGLAEAGADFSGLSGSGSTCFGIFASGEKAAQAAETLSKRWPFVRLTFSLRAE